MKWRAKLSLMMISRMSQCSHAETRQPRRSESNMAELRFVKETGGSAEKLWSESESWVVMFGLLHAMSDTCVGSDDVSNP